MNLYSVFGALCVGSKHSIVPIKQSDGDGATGCFITSQIRPPGSRF